MNRKNNFIQAVDAAFEREADADNAPQMAAYMKDQFPFKGVMATARRAILRKTWKETQGVSLEEAHDIVSEFWDRPEREYQYLAIDLLIRLNKKLPENWIDWIKELIITKSWWDTVDALASNVVGPYLKEHPRQVSKTVDRWINDENLWLRRTSLLYQLKYKESTDTERLFEFIRKTASEKEFFIAKAIGWALREYSKTDRKAVQAIIEKTELQPLSVREGSKYLK